jgi:hypothetical protein
VRVSILTVDGTTLIMLVFVPGYHTFPMIIRHITNVDNKLRSFILYKKKKIKKKVTKIAMIHKKITISFVLIKGASIGFK